MTTTEMPVSEARGVVPTIRFVLALLMLIDAFVLVTIWGPRAAYAELALLIVSLLVLDLKALRAALADGGVQLFAFALLLLAIAFLATMQIQRDILAVFDFSGFVVLIPAYALFRSVSGKNTLWIFPALALLATIALCAQGTYEITMQGESRADGGTSSIFFSDFSVLFGFLALGGLFLTSFRYRWVFILGPFFGLAGGVLGGTRGSLVVAGVLTLLFLVFAMLIWKERRALILVALLVLFGAAALLAGLLLDSWRFTALFGRIWHLLASGSTEDNSIRVRLDFYQAGLHALADSPIVGHGWFRRFTAAAEYFTGVNIDRPNSRIAHLHNEVINFGSAAGALGIMAYAAAMAAPVVSAARAVRDAHFMFRLYIAICFSLGIVAMGLTDVMFVFETTKTMHWVLAAAVMAFLLPPLRQSPAA